MMDRKDLLIIMKKWGKLKGTIEKPLFSDREFIKEVFSQERIIEIIKCLEKEDPEPCCHGLNVKQLIDWIKTDRRKLNETQNS